MELFTQGTQKVPDYGAFQGLGMRDAQPLGTGWRSVAVPSYGVTTHLPAATHSAALTPLTQVTVPKVGADILISQTSKQAHTWKGAGQKWAWGHLPVPQAP